MSSADPSTAEDWPQMITDCVNRWTKLSPWEQTFITNTRNQLGRGLALTPAQVERLDEIWERIT
jgi:hypothetical protein